MFGGEAIGVIIVLLLAFVVSIGLALLLGFIAIILWRKKKRRAAVYFSLPMLCLLLAWTGFYLYFSPPKKKPYTVSFAADPSARFSGLPAGRVMNFRPGLTEHQIWGILTVEIRLPDGKIVQGMSDRLTVMDTTNGLAYFTLFYTSSSRRDELFQYWTEGGKLNETSAPGKQIQVDRQGYSLELRALAPAQETYQMEVRFPSFKLVQPAAFWGIAKARPSQVKGQSSPK